MRQHVWCFTDGEEERQSELLSTTQYWNHQLREPDQHDGLYLHQVDATVWAQGNTDTSHGCLNLNSDNAKWLPRSERVAYLCREVAW